MKTIASVAVLAGTLAAHPLLTPSVAVAEEPRSHILSAQDLCNLAWPASQAMPSPSEPDEAFVCVRHGGVLQRLANAMPTMLANTKVMKPGSALELPIGSFRVNPNDPMSAWVIPDCHVPGRLDCTP